MLIYLDNCSLQRPFDDRTQHRIRVEAEATPEVAARAESFIRSGAAPLDALYLASAIEGGARYFATSDDRLLRLARRLDLDKTEAVSLLHLIEEVHDDDEG